jgi:hypothetical protein
MKITRYMGAFAVIAMLAACSTDDELGANTAANEVKIAATVGGNSIFTRSNPVGTEAEQQSFNENDAISVTTEGKTVVYTKNKTGQWANANDYQLWTGNAQTFEAFYPGNSTNSISEGHIEADQSDITKIAQSDYMTCTENVTKIPDTRQLTLNFERQTARIIVKVSAFGNQFETRIPTLSAVEVYSKLKVPAGESDSYVGIQACKKDNVFYALVSPGTANSTEKFLKLTVTYNDGVGNPTQTKELYVTGIPALEKAKSYTYDVRIGKDNAIIGSVSVADWGTGDAITGGDASILTPELIIKQALAAGKTDITLNLAKDFNDFSKITDALKNAKKGTIDLTLKGCERIEGFSFNSVESLKSINLPDVIAIYPQAFSDCCYLESVYAPNVMHIESFVFAGCSWLREVELGNISTAGFRIFDVIYTENVDLILSKDQKVMTGSDDEGWQSDESIPYAESEDHKWKRFLGKTFKSIKCGSLKFE